MSDSSLGSYRPDGSHPQAGWPPIPGMSDSIPRWRTEDIDEHVGEKAREYEAAIETLENEIRHLRDGVKLLEEENDRLKWELLSPRRRYMRPPVISFFGFQMDF